MITDIFDVALNPDAVRKAAKTGEDAAAFLLVVTKGREGLFVDFIRRALGSAPEGASPAKMRSVVALMMAQAAMSAPERAIRKKARRYLDQHGDDPGIMAVPVHLGEVDADALGNPETLEELVEAAFKQAEKFLLAHGHEATFPGTYLLRRGDGELAVIEAPPPSPDGRIKDAIVEAVREVMHEYGAIAYTHVCEVWVSPDYSNPRPPREREDRSEGVMVSGSDKDGRSLCKTWEIIRNASGRVVELKLTSEEGDVTRWSRHDGLLEERR
jgi:hypothetical protein